MSERYSSSRKHKKHKTPTGHKHEIIDSPSSNGCGYSSTSVEFSSTQADTESSNKPLRLLIKVSQSGSYSPAFNNTNSSMDSMDLVDEDGSNINSLISSSTQAQPPQLLPLTIDSFQQSVDLLHLNNLKKLKKVKKKKKHHHHSNNNRNSHQVVESASPSFVNNVNHLISGTVASQSDQIMMDQLIDEQLSNHSSSNLNLLNDIVNDQLPEDYEVLINQDSILSSVDFMDIDSCSKLDISALVPDDDSQQSGLSMPPNFSVNSRLSVRNVKRRPTSSIYRKLLQSGEVKCDSNNIYEVIKQNPRNREPKKPFDLLLLCLLKRIRHKDTKKLFAWPVTDLIAPGYSQVVAHPMDFSTIEKKIEHKLYKTVAEVKFDVRLLCENALRYYRQSGVQYRDAARLWHFAKTQVFSRDALAEILKQFPPLTFADIGVDNMSMKQMTTFDGTITNGSVEHSKPSAKDFDDQSCPAGEILQRAANSIQCESVEKFTLNKPAEDHLEMVRQQPDGSTSLSIISDYCGTESNTESNESKFTLGTLVGKLSEGNTALPAFSEPEPNRIRLYNYAIDSLHNSFSSYLPYLDSSYSSVSLDETSILLNMFSNCESKHKESIETAADNHDYMISFVDSILSIVSNGQYQPSEVDPDDGTKENICEQVLTPVQQHESTDLIQEQLEQTQSLLSQLEKLQSNRLRKCTEPLPPSSKEEEVAHKVTNHLVQFISRCTLPHDITDVRSVRKAMGIVIQSD